MMHVFTYGTLMFPEVWEGVVGRSFASVDGTAQGYAVFRVRDAVFPGMIDSPNSAVQGTVYLDVDHDSLMRLDKFEDHFYDRRAILIECNDGLERIAQAYIVPAANTNILTDEPWNRDTFVSSGGLQHFISRFAGFRRIAEND
jgi:gamma-glutamylcyclotransferase (GGCT)/AIG2-like uncharacterized protein YtfP